MGDAFQGFQELETFGSQFNAQTALVKFILATIRTSTLVEVVSCTNNGALAMAGTVNVQPLINQLDGYGNQVPHGIIYSLPYSRIQGGTNAIIIDPEVGDKGVAIFSDRDISNVIATKKQANPGSNRKFDMADGIYIGWILNATPTQYIQFNSSGIKIYSPHDIVIQATGNVTATAGGSVTATARTTATITAPSGLTINANIQLNGTLTTTGLITAPDISII